MSPSRAVLLLSSSPPDPATLEALLRDAPAAAGRRIVVDKAPHAAGLADPPLPPGAEYRGDGRRAEWERCSACTPPLALLKPLLDPPGPAPWRADECTWLLCRFRALLAETGVGAVVAGSEVLPHGRAAVLAARSASLPSFQLQHGLPVGWWGYAPSLATRVLAWGPESARRLASFGIEPGRIAVTGSPRFDALERSLRALRAEREALRASFGAGPRDGVVALCEGFRTLPAGAAGPVLRACGDLLRERPEARLLLKVHPAESLDAVASLLPPHLREAGERVRLVRAPLPEVLAAADLATAAGSSVAVEAAAAGIPSATFLPPSTARWFFGAAPLPWAADGRTLSALLDDALAGRPVSDGRAVRALHFPPGEGGAAERVFREIDRAGRRDRRGDPELRRLFLALGSCPWSPSRRMRLRARAMGLVSAGRGALSALSRRGTERGGP